MDERTFLSAELRNRLERFLRRAFPARVFCSAREWPPRKVETIIGNAFQLIEPKTRFIRAAKDNPEPYIWVCLKNAVRDQVWAMVPEDLQELHAAVTSALRKSNGFTLRRQWVGLDIWPPPTPPCPLEYQTLLETWKGQIKAQPGPGRLGLKRGFLKKAFRAMLSMAQGLLPRSSLYQGTRDLFDLPHFVIGLPELAERTQTSRHPDTPIISSLSGGRRPATYEDLFAIQAILQEERPAFENRARELFEKLTPTQRLFAWASYHGWKKIAIATHLHVGAPRISNLNHQYRHQIRKALDPAWTLTEVRAFLEVWFCLLHDEPCPELPETRS